MLLKHQFPRFVFVAALLLCASGARGDFSNNFSGPTGTGGGTLTDGSANDGTYYTTQPTRTALVTNAAVDPTAPNQVLSFSNAVGGGNTVLSPFSAVTIPTGGSINFSFKFALTNTGSADGFRFGIFNDGGTPVTGNSFATATISNDDGVFATILPTQYSMASNTNNASGVTNSSIFFGTRQFSPGNTNYPATISSGGTTNTVGTTAHTGMLTLFVGTNGITQTRLTVDGVLLATSNYTTAGGTPSLPTTFNEIAFIPDSSTDANTFYLDNISVTTVPEPKSAVAAGIFLAALVGWRLVKRGARTANV